MRNFYFFFIVTACNSNNFLHLAPGDKDTAKIVKGLTSDVNAGLGCDAWSLDNDKVILDDKTSIDRRLVSIERNSKEIPAKDLGFYDIINNEIYYSESFDFETWSEGIKFVLMHELGHAMGLEHEPNTVMNEKYSFMPYAQAMQSLIDLLNKHNKNQCNMIKE